MRRVITGEQVAQIYNPDPFARPVFRAPVYQTPAGLILLAWLARLLYRLARLAFRHPVTTVTLALLAFLWFTITWIGLIAIVACANLILATWRWFWPSGFARWVSAPARNTRRARVYRRRWPAVMTIADLAPLYRGRIILPVLVKVTSTRYVDRVAVRLVSGQCAADFAARADILAHGFGAMLCRVRSARSGAVVLEFVRRDALATVIPALPIPALADLKALPVGRREDGLPWLVRLHGTCANWLRYGIQPKNARPGLVPGRCKGKAHHPDHLGYAGRRVLVSGHRYRRLSITSCRASAVHAPGDASWRDQLSHGLGH